MSGARTSNGAALTVGYVQWVGDRGAQSSG
jgi:hypothetical protein